MERIIYILDGFLFVWVLLSMLYLLYFAIRSQKKAVFSYPVVPYKHRIRILFPAYKEDNVILGSVQSFLSQDYPKDKFLVTVISDGMRVETLERLKELSCQVIVANLENSSKAASLQLSVLPEYRGYFDLVVILDADNQVGVDFLSKLNDVYDYGVTAMQAHRISKGETTDIAVLDKVSEEINNSIFRLGHTQAGLSSALIGSGMAFDYNWFVEHISMVTSAGEDKELELLLLREGVYIEYLPDVFVYDEKVSKAKTFSRQRRRWIAAQADLIKRGIGYFPMAVFTRNWDYCDKILQWLIPPRIVLVGFSFLAGCVWLFFAWNLSVKWWIVLFLLLIALSLAMPDELYTKSFKKALWKLPLLFLLTFVNLFRTRGVNKRFIHTSHGE